jgi:signal transduction histidine kinase/DNA-binding response OmpR family regulator/ligand-binding sensor domain-containing protein
MPVKRIKYSHRFILRKYLFFLLLFQISAIGHVDAQDIVTRAIPSLDKLPVSAIHRIFQDSDGYIWYGTFNGLCRYDGYNIKTFRSDLYHPGLLASNYITYINEDHEKKIWFGTLEGAYILDKATLRISPVDMGDIPDPNVFTLNVTRDGTIWINVRGALLRYRSDGSLMKKYKIEYNNSPEVVYLVYETNDGELLISIASGGLYRLNRVSNEFEAYFHNKDYLYIERIIHDATHGYYWLGTWGKGIVRFDPQNKTVEQQYIPQSLPVDITGNPTGDVFHMVQDDIFHYIWVTTQKDLFAFRVTDKGMLEQVDTSPFLAPGNKMLYEIFKDKDSKLWVSAFDMESFIIDIREYNVKKYALQALKNRIKANPAIASLYVDEEGIFWFSQDRYGLCIYDPKTDEFKHYSECKGSSNLSLGGISCLAGSHTRGRVWAVQYSSTLFGFRRQDMEIKEDIRIQLPGVSDDPETMPSLFEDAGNNLWIGTPGGLFVYRIRTATLEVVSDSLGQISGITQTADGRIWMAVKSKGICVVDSEKRFEICPFNKDFVSIDATSDGKLWLGTGNGEVLLFDPYRKELKDYSFACGMKGDIINSITVDVYNHVWIATNQQIKEYNPHNGAYRSYSTRNPDFLLTRLLSRAVCYDGKGEIFFGGVSGVISIPPSQQLESISEQVITHITDIKIMGQSIWEDASAGNPVNGFLRISPNAQNLEIEFSSLDFHNLDQVRYAYRMAGVDNDWVYLDEKRNSAFYNRLDKGKYTFQVKATDKNGLWSDKVTEFTIHRLPAWYETGWAYALYFIMAAGILWVIIYLYLQRIKQANDRKFTEQVTQMKLRYFTNISHELLTPLTILSCLAGEIESSGKEDRKRVSLMQSNIRRLKRLLQQVLDFRKAESKNMKLLVSYGDILSFVGGVCEDSFALLMKKKKITFSFSANRGKIEGYYDQDKLDKILFNLLSNACKYTPQGKSVILEMETYTLAGHEYLKIRIKDEGIGIASKELDKIFTRFYNNNFNNARLSNGIGLSLTKELIELHHGKITVESQPGEGSVFTVEIPIDKESYISDELKETFYSKEQNIELPADDSDVEHKNLNTDYTLLLVEDNRELLLLMKNIFSKTYNTATAENGQEALDYIKTNPMDIVISDIMMPKMDGLELCKHIKNDISTSHIIVILLTARISAESQIDSYEVGADDYIPKPFEPRVLKVRLENLLNKRKKIQAEFKNNPKSGLISNTGFTSMDERLIEKALKFVEDNLSDPNLDVAVLADNLNMSRSTLSRKIKAITGQTPLDFIKDIKMQHARRMLENKMTTVSEVITALGYNDHKHFTTSFKETFGITPSEYQKKIRE